MSSAIGNNSRHALPISSIIATCGFAVISVGHGRCSVPGCCDPRAEHSWTYTVGLVGYGHPEIVLLGLDPESAAHGINWVGDQAKLGQPVPVDVPMVLDHVGIKLVDVPVDWLATDLDRMSMWFNHYAPSRPNTRLPEVRQLVWADAAGKFPDDPSCDVKTRAAQPLLSHDPTRFPAAYPSAFRPPSRHERRRRR
jgi:hypothetical protein